MRPPYGCDQQGRYPQAVEPCDDNETSDLDEAAALIVGQILTIIAVVAFIALAAALS